MLFFEPIILFTAIFISLAWSMVFFYFQAYPIIFQGKFDSLRIIAQASTKTNFAQGHTNLMWPRHLLHTSQVSKFSECGRFIKLIRNSGHRCRIILCLRPLLRCLLRKVENARKALGVQSRISPTPSILCCWAVSNDQSFLAGMVGKTVRPLDCARALGLGLRNRLSNHLHLASHICYRCIPYLLCECIGFFSDNAEYCGCSVPSCRRPSLRKAWSIMGNFGSWICELALYPYSFRIALFWALD